MSEISAIRFNAVSAPAASRHHDGGLRARTAKLLGYLERIRNAVSVRSIEAEPREIVLGRCGEKVNIIHTFPVSALESPFDELTTDSRTPEMPRDNCRAQERNRIEAFEADGTDDNPFLFSNEKPREVFANALDRKIIRGE
ncbi:MAG TPA: hypothetical protein VHL32_06055 [Gemmatimonadaceae bacterium]|jgi:hypothetical protein|nr:hypothetical protein [Gemmatimonadaceae bacterium]